MEVMAELSPAATVLHRHQDVHHHLEGTGADHPPAIATWTPIDPAPIRGQDPRDVQDLGHSHRAREVVRPLLEVVVGIGAGKRRHLRAGEDGGGVPVTQATPAIAIGVIVGIEEETKADTGGEWIPRELDGWGIHRLRM